MKGYNPMKRLALILILLAIPLSLFAIKFPVKTEKMKKDLVFQAIFNLGFTAEAVSDDVGITDYQTFFFKPAFHVQDFGIGLDFQFRFRLFAGQPPYTDQNGQPVYFRTRDWYVPNDPLATMVLYLDKIDYIKYGDIDKPVFVTTGDVPATTFGTGFLVRGFHNSAFMPTSRENGLYAHFDGNKLDQYGARRTIPVHATLFITDLVDPDMFGFSAGVDILKFSPLTKDFSLKIDYSMAFDFDTRESNRLAGDATSDFADHRSYGYTSGIFGLSAAVAFGVERKQFKLTISDEFAGLVDLGAGSSGTPIFGWGNVIEADVRLINIKKSGYLLGLNLGFVVEGPGFFSSYFSSNYEVARRAKYDRLHTKQVTNIAFDAVPNEKQYNAYSFNQYVLALKGGIGLYGFQEKLKFELGTLTTFTPETYEISGTISNVPLMQIYSHLMLARVIPGLTLNLHYQNGYNLLMIYGTGTGFLDFLVREFRFSVDVAYSFFGAKINVLVGVQAPGRVIPTWSDTANDIEDINAFNSGLQKFVALEVSFVI
jgi:hypothetical protein